MEYRQIKSESSVGPFEFVQLHFENSDIPNTNFSDVNEPNESGSSSISSYQPMSEDEIPSLKRRLSDATLAASDIRYDLSVEQLEVHHQNGKTRRNKLVFDDEDEGTEIEVENIGDVTIAEDDAIKENDAIEEDDTIDEYTVTEEEYETAGDDSTEEEENKPDCKVEIKKEDNTPLQATCNSLLIKTKETKTIKRPKATKILKHGHQLTAEDLQVLDIVLGEGQMGMVHLANYKNLFVACKSKRVRTKSDTFYLQIESELKFAAELSMCRNINRYIGWIYCKRNRVETDFKGNTKKLYVLQRYVANGDARSYLDKREAAFQPSEALQASVGLFSALTDAHELGIGIVDLKLENFLIDSSGVGWLTDFGSCIEFNNRDIVDLEEEDVAWTVNVSSPEMIKKRQFCKASDVFMATLIVAELLTADLSDDEFNHEILQRKEDGSVDFSSARIHPRFEAFFDLLSMGLSNDPIDRPSADTTLAYLLQMKFVE
ncbi:hypothetical protein INT47_007846 [Mucor saturninus]|uniref:non-specific serine/threonine protein kinase n=1 Tax=Mucor saturninus TaxID=64648 RepID=A0A8H7V7U5_9FUNG|nr:hypothetical protein INT47_007846 [Mucor saturninus]